MTRVARARHRPAILACMAGLIPAVATAQPTPRPLSRFDRQKAEWLLRQRLPCLGCHRLGGAGGVIGPDLTDVARRRTASFIDRMVSDPQATLPGSSMPKIPMPEDWRVLIASYLAARTGGGAPPAPGDPPGAPGAAGLSTVSDAATLYRRVCAGCHGEQGKGDGFNAPNLPVPPTAHSDSAYMSGRPDDTLFDGVFAGGYILNRSHLMPPWGETLSREQIWALVRYMRQLCRCTGPAWSRDGAAGAAGAAEAAEAAEEAEATEEAEAEGKVRRARSSR